MCGSIIWMQWGTTSEGLPKIIAAEMHSFWEKQMKEESVKKEEKLSYDEYDWRRLEQK